MTLDEIEIALADDHERCESEGFYPRFGIYNVLCYARGNGRILGGSTRLPKAFCEHPEQLRRLVRDHHGDRVICFYPNRHAARDDDLRIAARVSLREIGRIKLGRF